jgi:hypothetical protein
MKKVILVVLISFLFSLQCNKKNEGICYVNDPLQDLAWLKQIKYNFEMDMSPAKQRISHYNYKDQSVFLIENCVNCSDEMSELFDCDGKKICEFGGIAGLNTCPDFHDNAVLQKILFEQ